MSYERVYEFAGDANPEGRHFTSPHPNDLQQAMAVYVRKENYYRFRRTARIIYPMLFTNPAPVEICRILSSIQTIAVVGLSANPGRPSFKVARGMQDFGYRIVPVRPQVHEVLGEKAYPDLESLPFKVDMVDVFRAPEHVPAIVESCIALGIPCLWLQEGVIHEEAAQRARAAGILTVMDRCMWRDRSQLCAE